MCFSVNENLTSVSNVAPSSLWFEASSVAASWLTIERGTKDDFLGLEMLGLCYSTCLSWHIGTKVIEAGLSPKSSPAVSMFCITLCLLGDSLQGLAEWVEGWLVPHTAAPFLQSQTLLQEAPQQI